MKKQYIAIHRAIHDRTRSTVLIDGQILPIEVLQRNQCRYVEYKDPERTDIDYIQFMEQNKKTQSLYAKRAKEGENITWGIPHKNGMRYGKWILVTDKSRVYDK